ncbi:MAG: radical SAM/SPASM domain-containing protein [Planctomycetota bacterium]
MRKVLNQCLSYAEKKCGRRRVACRPWKVFLEVASSCNLRCITCMHHGSRFGGVMSDEVFDRVRPLLQYARVVNEVGYGEPLIDKGFLNKLAYAKRQGASVYMYSNGTLLSARIAEEMVSLGLDQITFSIDGATRETFESIRLGASREKVLANIRGLAEAKRRLGRSRPLLRANYVGMRRNIGELPRAVDVVADVGIEELVLSDFWPHRPELENECLGLMEAEARTIAAEAASRAKQRRITFIAPPVFHGRPNEGTVCEGESNAGCEADAACNAAEGDGFCNAAGPCPNAAGQPRETAPTHEAPAVDYRQYPCYEPWQTVYITHDGHVRPCCVIGQSMGNLMKTPLEEIWNNRAYQLLRQTVNSSQPAYSDCRNCLLRKRVRLPVRDAVRLGLNSLRAHGLRGTARKVAKYVSEYL